MEQNLLIAIVLFAVWLFIIIASLVTMKRNADKNAQGPHVGSEDQPGRYDDIDFCESPFFEPYQHYN